MKNDTTSVIGMAGSARCGFDLHAYTARVDSLRYDQRCRRIILLVMFALGLVFFSVHSALADDNSAPVQSNAAAAVPAAQSNENKGAETEAQLIAALREAEEKYGAEDPRIVPEIDRLSNYYHRMGQYKQALPVCQRSLTIREKVIGPEHPDTATNLNNLAVLRKAMGHYDLAMPLHQRSLEIREKVLGPEHPATAESLNNLAGVCLEMGHYDQAIPLYLRSLKVHEKVLGAEHPGTATNLKTLAVLYYEIGQFDRALSLYQRSLAIREKVLGPEHPDTADSLSSLALLYITTGQYDQALPLVQRSLAIQEKVLRPEHPLTARSLNNLAGLYHEMGKNDQALPLFLRSLAIQEKALGPGHRDTTQSLLNIGALYVDIAKLGDAEQMLHQSIIRTRGNPAARNILWHSQGHLSAVYKKLNHPDLAILWGKEAVNTVQSLRTELKELDKELQTSFLKDKRHVYQNLADLLIAEGRIGEAQTVLQMLKEQELYDGLVRAAKADPRGTRIELTGLERKRFAPYYALQDQQVALGNEREQLERKQKTGELNAEEKKRLDEINTKLIPPLRDAMMQFLVALQKESDEYTKDKDYRKHELALAAVEGNLQKALKQFKKSHPKTKTVALQYVVTDTRLSVILSIAGNPPLARQIEIDGKALRQQVLDARELLERSSSDTNLVKQIMQKLYALLIQPIAADLKTSHAQTLVLVPNDVLRYVPFAALYDGQRYLVEDYALVLFNEAVKKEFEAPHAKPVQLAAMGLTREVEDLAALTNVRGELDAVSRQSGAKARIFLDDQFTRLVLTSSLKQDFNALHIASHFKFVAGRPDASRLFLGDRSSLYLGDIAREDLRFDQFGLVAFSACETGLGGGLDDDGREMESLGALVQNQGAQAVMVSLWKVADESTAELMDRFYRGRYQDKLDMARALQKVQIELINNTFSGRRAKWNRLFYWAPFVLMGDWR